MLVSTWCLSRVISRRESRGKCIEKISGTDQRKIWFDFNLFLFLFSGVCGAHFHRSTFARSFSLRGKKKPEDILFVLTGEQVLLVFIFLLYFSDFIIIIIILQKEGGGGGLPQTFVGRWSFPSSILDWFSQKVFLYSFVDQQNYT